jgi:hypothetical protein
VGASGRNILTTICAPMIRSAGGIPAMTNRHFMTGRMRQEGKLKEEKREPNCDDAKANSPKNNVH